MYLWERPGWPGLTWDEHELHALNAQTCRDQGRLLGRMAGLGFRLREQAHLETAVEDVVKSSAIEGERLDAAQVRSSVARRLGGVNPDTAVSPQRHVEGIVEMMLDATVNHRRPLTSERLFAWHAALFPTGRSGMKAIRVGTWRDDAHGPMQVVSGPIGRERVHYQAPPAARVASEMDQFLHWFEQPGRDPVLTAGLAHLWFLTIHPFDDGNGRIARAISDLALARSENTLRRYYSLSGQIERERDDYYANLEWSQKGDVDVTRWLNWFLQCLQRAIASADSLLGAVLAKARFWERFAGEPFNPRQIKVLNRVLDGLDGKLNSSRWARMAKCSQDTATRDINDLLSRGVLHKGPGGGRSTSYQLVLPGDNTATNP
ncbi:MAG: Fic family protein [Gammaproteobacteria bacterium]|nr:Fic family protein [Gammaproteobacteria bacterium]